MERYCMIAIFDTKEKEVPSIEDTVKVFYTDEFINKYSEIIDKDKIYSKDEANKIFKDNRVSGFSIVAGAENNKGIDMIEELNCLEQRVNLNFQRIDWSNIEEYIEEVNEQGYKTEKPTEEEFRDWFNCRYKKENR